MELSLHVSDGTFPAANPRGWGRLVFTEVKPQPALAFPAPSPDNPVRSSLLSFAVSSQLRPVLGSEPGGSLVTHAFAIDLQTQYTYGA